MRFRLTLELTDRNQNLLPLNYQYELSSWIYKVLHNGNPEFADWLHTRGFMNDKKQFRLFTFSHLLIPERKIDGDRLHILSSQIRLIVSMVPDEMVRHFITGLFQDQVFILGDRISQVSMRVTQVEALPVPDFSGQMRFSALSPIVISWKSQGDPYAKYLSPSDPSYSMLFFRNLYQKRSAFPETGSQESVFTDCSIKVITEPRKKGIMIKTGTPMQSKVIGYAFDFNICAPEEIIRFGYYTGFGEKNSMGFGCVELKTKRY
jgi:CRISPR-associated endoribonuclease Cas6